MILTQRKNSRRCSKIARFRRLFLPMFERLEDRLLMATVNWIGGSGDWNTISNWSDGATSRLPIETDDAVINVAAVSVTHSTGVHSVKSLTVNDPFTLSGGSLSVAGNLAVQNGNTFGLGNGTLVGATVAAGSKITQAGNGTLDGVTIASGSTFQLTNGVLTTLSVKNGLTVDGTVLIGDTVGNAFFGSMVLTTTQTIGGHGSIVFGNNAANGIRAANNGTTVTLGPDLTVRGTKGVISGSFFSGEATHFVLQGTISSDMAGGSLEIGVSVTDLVNSGRMDAINGGSLIVRPQLWTNTGTTSVSGSGSLSITANSWTNTGTLSMTNSTINLGGKFDKTKLGTFTRTGGTVNLTGTLTSNGTPLVLNASTGIWNLATGGELQGITLETAPGFPLIQTGYSTLNGVAIAYGSTVQLTNGSFSQLSVKNGLTVDGTVLIGDTVGNAFFGSMVLTTTQTIGGSGSIIFGNNAVNGISAPNNGTTVTLGPNLTVRGKNGSISGSFFGQTTHYVLQGTVSSDVAGGSLEVGFAMTDLVISGRLEATNGGSLIIGPQLWTNTGMTSIAGGGTLSITANSWTNTGTLSMTNSTIDLGGAFDKTKLGTFTRTGGSVNVTGTYDNAGSTLALGSSTGSWTLKNGTIVGGTISTSGTEQLFLNNGTLQGVTLAGVAEVQADSFATGGLTLNGGQLIVDANRRFNFKANNQSLTGNGTVVFAGTGGSLFVESNRQLMIGAGIVISGGTGANVLDATASGASGSIYATISTGVGASVSLTGNWSDHSVRIVPSGGSDGGPIKLNVPTPGKIEIASEVDNWTYFARAGQALNIFLNPTTGISPALGFAQLQVRDPANNIIGTAAGTVNRQSLQLVGVTFPADGTYTIRVQASPSQPTAAGNYLLTAYEATLGTRPLILNQQVTGVLKSHYSVDRWTFSANANQQVQLHLLGTASPGIRFQLTGPNGFVGFTELNADSVLVNLPTTGAYVLQATGNQIGFGAYTFRLDETNQTLLSLGATYNGSLSGSGFVQLFRIDVTQSAPLLMHFNDATISDRTEVYARLGSPPTRQAFDASFNTIGADHLVVAPYAPPGAWYVLVYGDRVPSASNFTLLVETQPIAIVSVAPDFGVLGETSQVTITGVGFAPGTQFHLVPVGGGAAIPTQRVSIDSTTQATAIFDLTGVPLAKYDVRATRPTVPSSNLPGAFQVGALGGGKLETRLILPTQLGRHAFATIYVEYQNVGDLPMLAPILILQSGDPDNSDRPRLTLDQSRIDGIYWTDAILDGSATSVQIYASGAAPGLLLPGERVRVPVYYAGLQQPHNVSDTDVEFELLVHAAGDTSTIDWPSLQAELRPDWIATDVWPVVFANLHAQIGTTWADYVQMLSSNASYLGRLGERILSVEQLYGFELQQALGLDPVGTLASAIDASATSPGVSLTFGRSFGNTISERYRNGPFGRGWNTSWQQYAEPLPDGTVIVHLSADGQRRFQPDIRNFNAYLNQPGETGTLGKVAGGAFELTESSGSVTRFLADGKLNLVRDAHGNSITASYTNNRITSLTHSSGLALGITYNAVGHIASITDPFGRTTTFGYDPTDNLLLTATDAAGTVRYTYSIGTGAVRDYALTSITDPSGVKQSYEYDTRGRLTASFVGVNIDRTTYAYDEAGTVTITDAANVFSKIFFNHNRQVARVEDSTGYYINTQFDANFQPVIRVDALGAIKKTTWTASGSVRTRTDELGATTTYVPGGPLNQPLSLLDARKNTTRYTYNSAGDVTATTYVDNSVERATYDVLGNVDVLTNRRGQTNDQTVNAAGQVTRESRSDGTIVDYTYDSLGRLRTATDTMGTTTLSYDSSDRLTRVEYPNGRWIQYAYDAAGRRTRLEDPTGFVEQYVYDSAGRLERLLDAANALIVRYSYETGGRLSREDKGNGTFTVYGYDVAGRVVSITHRAPNNSINAAFGYAYDLTGRLVSTVTPDGNWTYTYDLTDQLIRAVFISTNLSIPNQDLIYEYDTLGNRVRTLLNGLTTNYTANGLNQYTAAGSTTFSYDLDGNLIQETGSGGTKTYTYDLLNRLTSVQTPQGIWQYEYDVLGNRTAVIVDGQRTEYLIDPTGLGNVVGEYNGAGTRTSGYAHGLGLEGASSVTGWGYFDFDALGSTAGISTGTGGYVNHYAYDPFGKPILSNEGVANSFEFVGEFGVMAEGNGLNFMRARYYSSKESRFTSQDPIRLDGGDFNLYRYVSNDPLNQIDPNGLKTYYSANACTTFLKGTIVGPANRDPDGTNFCIFPKKPKDCAALEGRKLAGGNCAVPCDGKECIPEIPPKPPKPPIPKPPTPPAPQPKPPAPDVPKAIDPNEKLGSSGFGSQAYVLSDAFIPYRVNFENLGPGSVPIPTQPATAPAQRVEVTDQLTANLDWNTFRFTEFGFGDTIVTVPNGQANHVETLSMTYNNQTFDILVELTFDSAIGFVSAVFQSLDPATSLPPDVLTGFLPPEDGTGIGKAHIAYTIQPKAGLVSGTELRNVGLIRFDFQTSIATNQIDPQNPAAGIDPKKEALNTIDAGTPSSLVAALPAITNSLSFNISWSGSDDTGGSGIAVYDVFVSDNNGPYIAFLTRSTATNKIYTGTNGHTYRFYSVAIDNVGHIEAAPAAFDALTLVVTAPWQNNRMPTDVDNDASTSPLDVLLIVNELNSPQYHTQQDSRLVPRTNNALPFFDVDGDGFISPLDALIIINAINRGSSGGEGEISSSPIHEDLFANTLWLDEWLDRPGFHRLSQPGSKSRRIYGELSSPIEIAGNTTNLSDKSMRWGRRVLLAQ